MKKILWVILALIFAASSYAINKAKPFELVDYTNTKHKLSDYKNSRAIVVMFIATRCPVSNAYNERMEALYETYSDKGITFLGINSNEQENLEEIKNHAKENSLEFPVLKDTDNVVADQFGASVTPEVYVLNSDYNVLYHGRIDDSRREDNVTSHDLRNVLDKIVAGESINRTDKKAFGCTIKRIN